MPVELEVIRASEFVCLDTDEHLDFEASKKAFQILVEACRKRGLCCALIDLRDLPVLPKAHFTKTQIAGLVSTFREAGFTREQRLAILYRHDIYGGIRDFAFISRLRGLQVQAFTEFEGAMYWLSEAGTPQEKPKTAQGPVPIQIRKPAQKAQKLRVVRENLGPGKQGNNRRN